MLAHAIDMLCILQVAAHVHAGGVTWVIPTLTGYRCVAERRPVHWGTEPSIAQEG